MKRQREMQELIEHWTIHSEIGFAFCHLLGFRLLPRLKDIGWQKLYRPKPGDSEVYKLLQPVLTRFIDWDLIRNLYDEMLMYVPTEGEALPFHLAQATRDR